MARKKPYVVLDGPLTMIDRLQLMQAENLLQTGLEERKKDFRVLHRKQREAFEGQASRREALFSLSFRSVQDRAKCESQAKRLGLVIDAQGTVVVPCGRRDKVARVLHSWIAGVQDLTAWIATPGSNTKVVNIIDRDYRRPKRG